MVSARGAQDDEICQEALKTLGIRILGQRPVEHHQARHTKLTTRRSDL